MSTRSPCEVFQDVVWGIKPDKDNLPLYMTMYTTVRAWLEPGVIIKTDAWIAQNAPAWLPQIASSSRPASRPARASENMVAAVLHPAVLRAIYALNLPNGAGNIDIRHWLCDNDPNYPMEIETREMTPVLRALDRKGWIFQTGAGIATNWHLTNAGRAQIGVAPAEPGKAEAMRALRDRMRDDPSLGPRLIAEGIEAIRAEGAAEILALLSPPTHEN